MNDDAIRAIKERVTMRECLASYGIQPNRAGFIRCPFHSEKTASCKIYERDFYCFSCGTHGDIFTFVQKVENCSFIDAFKRLGGSWEELNEAQRKEIQKQRLLREAQKRELAEQKKSLKRERKFLYSERRLFKRLLNRLEPHAVFSTAWCICAERIAADEVRLDEIAEELLGGGVRDA